MSEFRNLVFFVVFAFSFFVQAQPKDKVELLQAGELEGMMIEKKEVRKLKGDVVFKQNNLMLYCDSAFQYVAENKIAAFGNVRILKGDSLEIKGEMLKYDGNTKLALITGKEVQMNEARGARLVSKELNFDMGKNLVFYQTGGVITHEGNVLNSVKGYYNTTSKIAYFKEKVVGVGENFKIESDTLHYHTLDKRAVFIGPTYLTNKDGKLFTEKGEYNTETEISRFESRTSVVQKEYILTADRITYDKKKNVGNATGNVQLTSLKDTVVVFGNKAIYKGNTGYTKVFENVLVKMKNGLDTLLLKTDTLVSVNDSLKRKKYIAAFPKAKLFKDDIQGICDSLVYNQIDSTIYMFKQPTLWAQKSQMNADSIRLQMSKSKLDKMYLRKNAIVISEDSIKNHNQVKGKNMLAHFNENKIQKVDVLGNGESVYFATENDTLLVGMNRIACSNMVIRFKENQINTFTFLTKPEARFVPEHEIVEPDKFLKGYTWRFAEIPRKDEMIR